MEKSGRNGKKREKGRKECYKKAGHLAFCLHGIKKFFDNFLKPSAQYKDPESLIAVLGKKSVWKFFSHIWNKKEMSEIQLHGGGKTYPKYNALNSRN